MMKENDAEAVALFREALLLCGVEPGQTVAIVAGEGGLHDRAEGFLSAAISLGASGYIVTLPRHDTRPGTIGQTSLVGQGQVLELLKQADLVVDVVFFHFSQEQQDLLDSGVRMLTCVEPMATLRRLFPTTELRRRVEAAAEQLDNATELKVTSEWGTDVSYQLTGGFGVLDEYGFTDQDGRWDHWPSGFVATHAADEGVDGTVVLKTGDAALLPVPRYVRDPVRFTIEEGFITSIDGDGLDAMAVRDYFEAAGEDRDALGVSHIGWGLNRDAHWWLHDDPDALCYGMDTRAYCGNVMFSTGPNTDVGGSRNTPFHLDIPMRDCSLHLDGEQVLDAGRLVVPAQQ